MVFGFGESSKLWCGFFGFGNSSKLNSFPDSGLVDIGKIKSPMGALGKKMIRIDRFRFKLPICFNPYNIKIDKAVPQNKIQSNIKLYSNKYRLEGRFFIGFYLTRTIIFGFNSNLESGNIEYWIWVHTNIKITITKILILCCIRIRIAIKSNQKIRLRFTSDTFDIYS